jgi:hypothetical protein
MTDQIDQDQLTPTPRRRRSRRRLGAAIVAAAVLGVGGIAYADHTGFPDVLTGQFFHNAVGWAAGNGITDGYGDSGLFRPELDVTRGEVVTFLHRAHVAFNPTQTLAASVSGGSLQRGVGATGANQQGNLSYLVTFNRDVSQCYYQATPSTTQRIARANPVNGQPTRVVVTLADLNGVHASGNFHLTVTCQNAT